MLCAKQISFQRGERKILLSNYIRVHPPRLNKFNVKSPNQFREGHSRPVASLLALGKIMESKLSRTNAFLLPMSSII